MTSSHRRAEAGYERYAEEFGSLHTEHAHWRVFVWLMGGLVLYFFVWWLALPSRDLFVPHIVRVPEHAYTVRVAHGNGRAPALGHIIVGVVRDWVVDWRSAHRDPSARELAHQRVVRMLPSQGLARDLVVEHWDEDLDAHFRGRARIRVELGTTILRPSGRTVSVDWSEERISPEGLSSRTRFSALIQVVLADEESRASVSRNPIGIFVSALEITEVDR